MHRWSAFLVAVLLLGAAPALAAPCKTKGAVDASITFPKNDQDDVQFARSMVPAILPNVSGSLPPALTCNRLTVSTALGVYALGGENADPFPRMAMPVDGKTGPVVYLSASPQAPGLFALVVHSPGSLTIAKRFYTGVPTDGRLAADIRTALSDGTGIMAYEAERKMVRYSFVPTGGVPAPVKSGRRADGTNVVAGPQIMVLSSGDMQFLNMAGDMRHTPSGFACPSTFDGVPVLLMTIDPQADYLACGYRAGTDLQFRQGDPIRYQLTLIKPASGETPRSVFDQLTASVRASLRIKGDHAPPLAIGPAPAPMLVAYWDTEDAGVQGVWIGEAGGWIVRLWAHYPPGSSNDIEAGKVARALFSQVAKQVK